MAVTEGVIEAALAAELKRHLGQQGLDVVLGVAEFVQVPAGGRLTSEGQPVDALFFVLEGVFQVSVEEGGQSIRLGRLGRGNWLGEVSLFSGQAEASASVTAETPAKVLKIRRSDFQILQRDHLEVVGNLTRLLIGTLVERLRKSAEMPIPMGPDGYSVAGSENVQQFENKQSMFARLTGLLQKVLGLEGGRP